MALTVTYVGATTFNDTTTPKTVATTWTAGDLVVVAAGCGASNGAVNTPTVAGLTFTLAVEQDSASTQEPESHVWTATAGSSSSGNVSVGWSSGPPFHWGFAVWTVAGHGGVGVTGANLTEATTSLTVAAGSSVFGIVSDWNATPGSSAPATGSGTATERLDGQTSNWRYWAGEWQGTSAGTFGFGLASYTGLKVGQAFAEVIVGAAAAFVANPPLIYPDVAAQRAANW